LLQNAAACTIIDVAVGCSHIQKVRSGRQRINIWRSEMAGKVTLVGAGPGGKGLLTLRGVDAVRNAEAVVYDRLVGSDILDLIPQNAERIDVGKESSKHPVPQHEINRILVRLAREGKNTVRLKGGDCYLFGRGGEECEYILENGIPFEVVPGVTSAIAVPAFAGIPVTHRDYCSSLHIITAHARAGRQLDINYEALTKLKGTLVFLMGLASLEQVMDGLRTAGMDLDTPAAVIENGARANQRKLVETVGTIAEKVRAAGMQSPALIIVGKVCTLSGKLDWFTSLPLHGKTVVVTRPRERAGTLSERLRELGADVIECPCIEIHEKQDLTPLKSALECEYDWAVFTSPAGVHATVHALFRLGRDLRALYKMRIAAIGKGTAGAFLEYGLSADLVPEKFDGLHLADALIGQMPEGGSVVLLRAQQGGEILPERLRDAGINVTDVPLYDTVYRCDKVDILRKLAAEGKLDYVTFTSVSTVEGFVQAAGELDYSGFIALCIGEQTEAAARRYGMNTVTAQNATIDGMVACVLEGAVK